MSAYYSVIQFIPDIVRNERINVGVVSFYEDKKEFQFVENFARVQKFGAEKSFLQYMFEHIKSMSVDQIKEASSEWNNGIQFTDPAPSLLDLNATLLDAAKRFLIDPAVKEKSRRTHHDVKTAARRALKEAISESIHRSAISYLKSDYAIQGRLGRHNFDIKAANGSPIFAANALSFQSRKGLESAVHATAWSIEDVLKIDDTLPLSVIVCPSQNEDALYQEALSTFGELKAEVVEEHEVDSWAKKMAEKVKERIPPHLL